MKTLVIHPEDKSTKFLEEIYEGKDWTIITYNPTKRDLKKEIKEHDRIIMLGHGTAKGLIGHGRAVIDSSYVYLLREKYCVFVWCDADQFVLKYGLKGFYTGMIISELDEAYYLGVRFITGDIEKSNEIFTTALTKSVDADDMLQSMLTEYPTSEKNSIIEYNAKRIYHT